MGEATTKPRAHGGRPVRRSRRVWLPLGVLVLTLAGFVAACTGHTVKRALAPEHCTARTAGGGEVDVDPSQAEIATTIVAVAIKLGVPARAVTVALATAEQESKLQNLDYGDRDSVGVFQQRPSQGWGPRERLLDPAYASARFYLALAKVHGWETMPIHVAAQHVQRSAYGPAYQQHEAMAEVLATALTGRAGTNGFTCLLRPRRMATTAAAVSVRVRRDWGPRAVAAAPGGVVVRLGRAAPGRHTLAMSYWLVARADSLGFKTVSRGGWQWRARDGSRKWHAAQVADPPAQVVAQFQPKPAASSSP
ncbi:MAG: hypothetical protein J2P24_00015 [Streptosporangiales bacterium]|nr:hypothetical protein [Streptosporangiales bacterium]MBO0890713.1 hypothetical protein [Acidothermales bacterium]